MKNSKLNTLLSKCDLTSPIPDDLAEWLDAPSAEKEIIPYSEEKSISSEEEYRAALKRIEELFDALPNTAEGDELEKWISLIESYENDHFPM
ncbi:MAG: transcriptional regulator [Shewanella oneidensis]|uniref:transcriptional regulator n=1 Tax=Shewanella xiamenensis TaxID=332186 RepID=UPI000DAFD667|nr:MAG: transcriptional regulator [Shewanella oneidensis]